MEYYSKQDIEYMVTRIDEIESNSKLKAFEVLEPTIKERKEVQEIILNYIIKNKRKIYGGFAMNELIKNKNYNDRFYKTILDGGDIEFYSPTPIEDVYNLCNQLHEAGYKYVQGKEAFHKSTYTISANFENYADISYVPKKIYNRIPFVNLNNMILTHPHFIAIDYFRMFTDPMTSYWRFCKSFKRFGILQKYFPFTKYDKELEFNELPGNYTITNKFKDIIEQFAVDNNSCIMYGFYCYNYFLMKSKLKTSYIKMMKIPYYQMISTNFKTDCIAILDKLKTIDTIDVQEHYPYFQFTGHKAVFKHNNSIILEIYHNNHMCIPYQKVDYYKFDSTPTKQNEMINIGTFDYNFLRGLISISWYHVEDQKKLNLFYKIYISHLLEMRKNYLDIHDANVMDADVFSEFSLQCIGDTTETRRKYLLTLTNKKKNHKFQFIYKPSEKNKKNDEDVNYKFPNCSGNIVNNPHNLRLNENTIENKYGEIEDDPEQDEKKNE